MESPLIPGRPRSRPRLRPRKCRPARGSSQLRFRLRPRPTRSLAGGPCRSSPISIPKRAYIDPDAVSDILAKTAGVRVLLVVHLYGLPCRMDALLSHAARYGLTVIEDAAQAHGAAFRGRRVGTFGSAAAFSFYPSKNLTTGEGGMVVTDDGGLAARARMLVNVGQSSRYVYEMVGSNYRMTEIAAAIGTGQLARLRRTQRPAKAKRGPARGRPVQP